jgi:hypothetical protein
MSTVSIQLPPIETDDYVEVDVTVNGKRKRFNYRVEVFRWEDWCHPWEERAEGLKRMITAYDRAWQLMEIGTPTALDVPLMFRRIA